jgi:hypothetical protein
MDSLNWRLQNEIDTVLAVSALYRVLFIFSFWRKLDKIDYQVTQNLLQNNCKR